MIKVSVIVPVYNNAKYISDCLNSVVVQTYENWELIIVDDGSIDGAGKICDDAAENDDRIRVIHQENKGVSNARNTGISNAEGDYIMFLDGDDMLCPDTLEELVSLLNEDDWDIISFDLRHVHNSKEYLSCRKSDYKAEKISADDLISIKLKDETIPAVASLYKKTIIKGEDILLFDEKLYYCEDALFYFQCVLKSEKAMYVNAKWYLYLQHDDSTVHSRLPYYKSKTDVDGWRKIKTALIKTENAGIIDVVNKRLDKVTYEHFKCDIDHYCRDYEDISEEDRSSMIEFIKNNMSIRFMIRDVKCWIKTLLFLINPAIFRRQYLKRIK